MERVTCRIEMRFAREQLDPAIQVLRSVVGRTESKPGCQSCSVSAEASEERKVVYGEVWESVEVLERHVRSEEFRWVLAAMEMCCEEPTVQVGTSTGYAGLKFLQELREKDGDRDC
jgi:quinol monooxygenase YgiN